MEALLASGGVDSSVAALLSVEQGLKPTLFYIIIGAHEEEAFSCPMEEDLEMVRLLGRQLGLEVETVDLHHDYWERVVDYLISSVRNGLTPNPDVMCNSLIKFGCFYDRVGQHFDQTITGHYATTAILDGHKHLATAIDPVKDQTDFLCQITPAQLARLHFPIGNMLKHQVRTLAAAHHLPSAHRADSQGICFLGNTSYNDLLRHYIGTRGGDIVEWETRKKLGRHPGYWFYTIGQRKGLQLSGGPWFVVAKNTRKNWVYVSRNPECTALTTHSIPLPEFHSVSGLKPPPGEPILFKIRHSPQFLKGRLTPADHGYLLHSDTPLQGVAPGQFAVIYKPLDTNHNLCIGSSPIGSTSLEP